MFNPSSKFHTFLFFFYFFTIFLRAVDFAMVSSTVLLVILIRSSGLAPFDFAHAL